MRQPVYDLCLYGELMKRVYVCHTFYHEYVAFLKELNLGSSHYKEADLILSTMSNDFSGMKERVEATGIFANVYYFDEKEDVTSKEVMACHEDRGNIVMNMLSRIRYTRLLGKLQEPYVPVDFSKYDDVYVFCDSDPIAYYLCYKKIRYHAIEDGFNSGKTDNQAMLANLGAWKLKKFMASLGLIFIECGYSRYCIDYEVNDISVNYNPPKNIVECSFDDMCDRLSLSDHEILAQVFLPDAKEMKKLLQDTEDTRPYVMILTEPLCDLDTRKRMFGSLIDEYSADYKVIVKPHPRDVLDYVKEFPDTVVIRGKFPMEVFNDIEGFRVQKLVSVITQVECARFADEFVYLGMDFLDKYEEPAVHRKLENLIKSGEK